MDMQHFQAKILQFKANLTANVYLQVGRYGKEPVITARNAAEWTSYVACWNNSQGRGSVRGSIYTLLYAV